MGSCFRVFVRTLGSSLLVVCGSVVVDSFEDDILIELDPNRESLGTDPGLDLVSVGALI